jgi:mannosyl-3-phosphoglycerate phosphatase
VHHVIFTDLDGTLLNHNTYSWEPARPALEHLRRRGVPWIFVTSKTRAEVELLRERMGNEHPFIVENGGAAFVPKGYFPFAIPGAAARDGFEVLEWGASYEILTAALDDAARETSCRVQSFHAMTVEETAAACGLPIADAALAKQREYDEPFVNLDPSCDAILLDNLACRGFRTTRGGRFYHVCGNNDKAVAVRAVRDLFARREPVLTIGLGDGWNDLPFLKAVDTAVIIRSPRSSELQAELPRALVTRHEGPEGWNQSVLDLLV